MEARRWADGLRRSVLEFLVLGRLERSPAYGYELIKELTERCEVTVTEGSFYLLLNGLKKAGMLETSWEESPSGPPRKYYSLTSHARNQIAQMKNEWKQVVQLLEAYVGGIR